MQDPIKARQSFYQALNKDGLYTKSYEDFEQQFSDPQSRKAFHQALNKDGLYTKSYEDFEQQFFSDLVQPTAEPLPEGFAGPGADKAQQMETIKKEGRKKEEAEVEALAESAGFRQITDDIIQGWAEDAAKKIATGEVDATAWSSGVEQFKSSLSGALDQAALADPATYINPEAMRGMMMSKEGRESIKKMREASQKVKRLQKEGYFKEGGMMEGAMKRQLLANEQFKQALKDKGLDPEATMEQAFQQGGISDAMNYIRMRVTQQGAQLTGAAVAGAVGGPVMAGGLMGASSAGGDLIGKALKNKKLSDEDRTAALAKGILEGTAESILSPVSKIGGTVTKRLFSGAAKEVAKQGGKAGLKQSLKKVLSASLKEGFEEAFVESMSPFIDEGVKQLYQEDADFDLDKFLKDNFGEKGRAQILESFVIGAATGSAAGGVDAATSTIGRRAEEAPATEAEEVSISKDKDVDFHTKNLFIENKPVEDVEQEVSNYLESLTEEQRSSLEGKEEALELAVEAYNERLKDEQASQEAPVETEGETQAEAEQAAPPVEATEEGGGEEGEGTVEAQQEEQDLNIIEEQQGSSVSAEQQGSSVSAEQQPTTQENVQQEEEQQSEQPTQQADVQEREDERMLEGVRDDRNEEQGGQEGPELRAEEEVVVSSEVDSSLQEGESVMIKGALHKDYPNSKPTNTGVVKLDNGKELKAVKKDGNWYELKSDGKSLKKNPIKDQGITAKLDDSRGAVFNWEDAYSNFKERRRGILKGLANNNNTPAKTLNSVFEKLKKLTEETGETNADIYYDLSLNKNADDKLKKEAIGIYNRSFEPSSNLQQTKAPERITYEGTQSGSYVLRPDDTENINKIADQIDPDNKTDLREVPKIAAALKNYTNGAPVIVHEDKAAAQAYLDKKYGKGRTDISDAAGFHDRADNTVHIIGKVPTMTRVAKHEFLHPFIEAIMVNNPDLAIDLYNKMAALPEFAPVRKWAEANYDKDTAILESMIDFFARVANGDIQIKPTTKDKIIQYINELLEAVGLDVSIKAADVDIKQFAASLAESMRTGREIVNPFQGKPNAEGLNKMVANNNANLFPTYSNIEAVYNNMPPKRREQLAPVMEAAKLAQEILDGNKGDLRAKVAAIQTQPIESLQYLERINRYMYMKGGHNTKEQAKAFMSATAEYMTDPVRSGTINFMRVNTSDPNQRSLKSFVERKDNNPDVNDEDIVKAVMIAYDLEQDDALEAFESILQRRYVPPATSFERTGARIHNAVARRVLNFITFGVKSNGELVTARDFVDHVRVNWLSDRYAPLRTARQRIEKAYDMKLPEDLDAAAVMDTAQAKAVEYEKGILKGFRGVGDKVGGKKHLKNSFFGRIKREGIKYQDVETFLFMQHLPEFLARKNDLIARKRQDKQAELDKLRDELSKATTKKEQQRLNAKINQIETTLASDSYTQKDALGTIERNGENVPLTAELATEIKNELEAKHPKLNQMSNDYRQELLNEYYNTLREFRMIPDERIDHLVNGTSDQSDVKWDYYVPMNVIDDVARDPNEIGFNSVGAMSAEGLNKLTAGGFEYGFRDRKDPLKQLVTNVIAVREQAEVNEGYRALARLLKQYGSDNWNIVKSRITAKENSKGEIIITEITPSVKDNNSIAFINEDGKKSYIVAKNVTAQQSPMFEAMQRGDTAPGWAARWINKMINPFSNYLRKMITSLNVTFGLAQIAPDFFDALVTTSVEMQKTTQGRVAAGVKYANNYRKAITYFMTGGMTDTSDAAVAWKEAQLHGMPMSWSNLNANNKAPYEYLEDQLRKLERAEDAAGLKKAMIEAGRALDRTANLLSDMNDAMENVARLAAYMTAKSYGLTPTQAAAKGRKDSVVRTLYLFYGAAVKSVARTTRTAKLLGIKGSLAMITGAALVRAYQYAMMDDDEMDQLVQNDFNRQGRIVLPVPGTDVNLNFKSPYSILRIYNSIGQGIVDIAYYSTLLQAVAH
jgi:hypothetical protein